MNDREKKTAPEFDATKSSRAGDTLASLITGAIANARPQSVAEGLLIITLAVGRTIRILGTIMGVDPKAICRDFCSGLTKYFEMGGDGRIDDITAAMKQKGN
ncbi:MAG: hypothetical protein J6Y33_03365 [Prevotella sp.]|nr:hypothetical protein [Prevotella sp.]